MLPLWDTVRKSRPTRITWALVLSCGLVFWWQLQLSPTAIAVVFTEFGLVPAQLGDGDWSAAPPPWRPYRSLLTYAFLHGGWVHLLSNLWILLIFGSSVEDRMGRLRFLLFYLLAAAAAGLMQYAVDPTSTVPVVGASGAVAGVLGAYMALFPRARIITFVPLFIFPLLLPIPAVLYLGGWFLSQFLHGAAALAAPGAYGGVAWWAHIGGFLAGLVFQAFLAPRR